MKKIEKFVNKYYKEQIIIINEKAFHLRLCIEEYNKLKKDSQKTGLTISDYLRKLIRKQKVDPKPPDSYSDLVWEISKIGIDINQIVHKINTEDSVSEKQADEAVFLLSKIYKLMREMR